MFCISCGASNEPGAQYCVKCGTPLGAAASAVPPGTEPAHPGAPESIPAPPPGQYPPYAPPAAGYPPGYPNAPSFDPNAKSKLAAGLMGIFLGWLGVHRFYLGYQNIAIAQLAVGLVGLFLAPFTCGLILMAASIWGLIDGIMILTGSLRTDGQGRPLRD